MTTTFHPTTTQSAAFDANRTPARHAAEATLREHGEVLHKQALRKQGLAALPVSLGLGLGTISASSANPVSALSDLAAAKAELPRV